MNEVSISSLDVMHWAEKYNGGPSIAEELQYRVNKSYEHALKRGSKVQVHPAYIYPEPLELCAGVFWCDRTIYLPPSVSLRGRCRATTLQFETTRHKYNTKGDGFYRIQKAKYLRSTYEQAVCILGVGNAKHKDFADFEHTSHERHIENLTIHARGDASMIVLTGRETNPVIRNIHGHGFGDEREPVNDACGIACSWPASFDFVDLDDDFYEGMGWRTFNGHDWATNGIIVDNFIEGFRDGILTTGSDMTISGNQFWDIRNVGLHIRNSKLVRLGNNLFSRMRRPQGEDLGFCYHIINSQPRLRFESMLPNWRNDQVQSDFDVPYIYKGARERYIKFDGAPPQPEEEEVKLAFPYGTDIGYEIMKEL